MTKKMLAAALVVGGLVALGSSPASASRLEYTINNLSMDATYTVRPGDTLATLASAESGNGYYGGLQFGTVR